MPPGPTAPDLNALHQFTVLARHLNFRRAAAELGLSPSTLSERMRGLEARLGARLLNRSTRSVALTIAGERLLARVADAVAVLREAGVATGSDPDALTGTVRINGPRPALELRLMPLVASFLARHPGVRMEIVAQGELIDIVAGGFDAGVRYDERLPPDMIAVRLGAAQRMVIVGHPAYLERRGRPVHPDELSGHECVPHVFARGNTLPWSLERDGREIEFLPGGQLLSANGLEIAAARQGLGLAYTFEDYVAHDLETGRLESVLDDWTPPFPGPSLYLTERRLMPPALRAFVDHVKRAGHSGEDRAPRARP